MQIYKKNCDAQPINNNGRRLSYKTNATICNRKNGFIEVSKNLAVDTDLKRILLDYQNYYVASSS